MSVAAAQREDTRTAPLTDGARQAVVVPADGSCMLCGARRTRRLVDYLRDGQRLALVRCRGCGLVRADPLPPEPALSAGGADEPWHWTGRSSYGQMEARRPALEETLDVLAKHRGGGRFLDVGCGPGFLLAAARERGFEPTGVDISRHACGMARELYGLDARPGTVPQQKFAAASFDVITAVEVVYYPTNPICELREYRRIISADGALVLVLRCNRWPIVFSIGDALWRLRHGEPLCLNRSALARFLNEWGTFSANYQFTTRTIRRALGAAGWQVCEIRNQRAGWPAEPGFDLRSALFGLYRRTCFALEAVTRRRCVAGPAIIVVARPSRGRELSAS